MKDVGEDECVVLGIIPRVSCIVGTLPLNYILVQEEGPEINMFPFLHL